MVQTKDILEWMDAWAPFRFAEAWDNSGLQVGDLRRGVDKVLVALDALSPVIDEARRIGAQCVVTHHPLLMRPIQSVRTDIWPGSVIAAALTGGISIIAAHTNLDASCEGTNAQLRRLIGLDAVEPLEAQAGLVGQDRYLGIGLVGFLGESMLLEDLAARLNESLGGATVRMTGNPRRAVTRVALCTGSGGSLIGRALACGADVFVTGDMKYHDGRLAEESGLAVLDIGHFASERLILEPMGDCLRDAARARGASVEVFVSKSEKDPFQVVPGNR